MQLTFSLFVLMYISFQPCDFLLITNVVKWNLFMNLVPKCLLLCDWFCWLCWLDEVTPSPNDDPDPGKVRRILIFLCIHTIVCIPQVVLLLDCKKDISRISFKILIFVTGLIHTKQLWLPLTDIVYERVTIGTAFDEVIWFLWHFVWLICILVFVCEFSLKSISLVIICKPGACKLEKKNQAVFSYHHHF